MKKILFLFVFSFSVICFAQTPRFKKYNVAELPVQVYLPTEPKWDTSTTGDGDEVYVYDDLFGKMNYTAIIVKIAKSLKNDNPEKLLESYMVFAENSVFFLEQKAGLGRGHTLDNQPNVKEVLQYGKSKNGKDYQIRGWTDGKYIAILATSSLEEMNYNIQELYLKGIRFPQ